MLTGGGTVCFSLWGELTSRLQSWSWAGPASGLFTCLRMGLLAFGVDPASSGFVVAHVVIAQVDTGCFLGVYWPLEKLGR